MLSAPYLTDLTDAAWALVKPVLPAARHGGRPRTTDPKRCEQAANGACSRIIFRPGARSTITFDAGRILVSGCGCTVPFMRFCCTCVGQNRVMTSHRRKIRNPLFAKRWFADEVIILCVRLYLRYKLSYRDLARIMAELGTFIAPCTILRWVIHYTPDFVRSWRRYQKPVGDSWRCDETYVKVGGRWMYLYRAVDQYGKTVESHRSQT